MTRFYLGAWAIFRKVQVITRLERQEPDIRVLYPVINQTPQEQSMIDQAGDHGGILLVYIKFEFSTLHPH